MHTASQRLIRFFSSRWFRAGVFVVFIFQALWMMLTAGYPMAFDEDFHLGVIRVYAEQWSPFLSAQPAGADTFGALVHDPSYLYHYIMSVPYRFMTWITDYQAQQVLGLRTLNVAMFVAGLWLFVRVLRRAGASAALTNLCLALVVLVPIVPTLAAQINYDNLIMVLVPLFCLQAFDILDDLKERRFALRAWLVLVLVTMLACLVKYAFLPIALGGVGFLLFKTWRVYRGAWVGLAGDLAQAWRALSGSVKVLLVAAWAVTAILFGQRYVVNIAKFHTPVPDCADALNEQQCMSYGPWARNTLLAETKPDDASSNPLTFARHWLYGMWFRLFFAVNGPESGFATRRPLPVASSAAFGLAIVASACAVIFWRRLFRGRAYMGFFLSVIIVYVAVLWLEQYSQFVETGQPVAINGRYLIPLLPLLLLVWARALMPLLYLLRGGAAAKGLVAAAVLAVFIYGGGIQTFIVRSDADWNWPNPASIRINENARDILKPILVEGRPS